MDIDDDKTIAARLFVHPFLKTDIEPLKGFGLGLAGTYGQVEGEEGLPDDGAYPSEEQTDVFVYADGVIADGTQWRLFPQAYHYWGPFGLMAEGGLSSVELRQTAAPGASDRVRHTAWQVTGSYPLTGEAATFRAVTPKRSFDPRQGGWGAWQLVARYSHLDIDDAVFPFFADPATSATAVNTWGVGLNWFLNRNVRVSFNFLRADLEAAPGADLPQDESAFFTRLQLAF